MPVPSVTTTTTTSSSSGGGNAGGPPVRHLRAQGSLLHKRSTAQHLTLLAAKGDVPEVPYDRVTEAFGAENWPHMLHTLEEGDALLRKRVLTAMTTVFRLPRDLAMCLKLGALELIEHGVLDDDHEIAQLSAHVLSIILESSAGRTEFMNSESAANILSVFTLASNQRTTKYLYDGFLSLTRSFLGAQLLTRHGYLTVVVDHLKRNVSDELRRRVLQLLKNLVNDGLDDTVFKAIELESVELCAQHLYDGSTETRAAACDAIAAMGCAEKAKRVAVDKGVVKKLCTLLTESQWQVAAASAGALMCLAVHDDAKRVIVAADALQIVNQLLQSPKYLVQLNTVKLLSVVASYPPARRQLNASSTEYHLRSLMSDADALLAKSAKIAQHAIQWQP